MAGLCSGAPDSSSFRHRSQHDHIRQNSAERFRRVSAGQSHPRFPCQFQQSAGKTFDPPLRQVAGQTQRNKGRNRFPAHGCDIAQPPRQTSVPHRLCRMPLPAKVHPFQTEIRGHQSLVTRGNPQNGAVISNAENDICAFRGLPAHAGYDRFLCKWQSLMNIPQAAPAENQPYERDDSAKKAGFAACALALPGRACRARFWGNQMNGISNANPSSKSLTSPPHPLVMACKVNCH